MKRDPDLRFDVLFEDAYNGLRAANPSLTDEAHHAIKQSVMHRYVKTGNGQADYERLRDLIQAELAQQMPNTGIAILRQDYVDTVVAMHLAGTGDVLERYRGLYCQVMGQHANEPDVDYVRRCAAQDYADGSETFKIKTPIERCRG